MSTDHWPELYSDQYAVKRISKSVVLASIQPGMSILDVGCHKEELRVFMPRETSYQGLDIIKGDNIDGQLEVIGEWDRIFCLETLEHLVFPQKTLRAINSHLKPDGLAVISLPNEATLFHRIRSLLGTVDQEAFSESGKHLHLPSLYQSLEFLQKEFRVVSVTPYVSDGAGTRQGWVRRLLKLLPLTWLATLSPSLFARGFIFVCKKK